MAQKKEKKNEERDCISEVGGSWKSGRCEGRFGMGMKNA